MFSLLFGLSYPPCGLRDPKRETLPQESVPRARCPVRLNNTVVGGEGVEGGVVEVHPRKDSCTHRTLPPPCARCETLPTLPPTHPYPLYACLYSSSSTDGGAAN